MESHASYFESGDGDELQSELSPGVFSADQNDGIGDVADPEVEDLSASTPDWMLWPGKWGSTDASLLGFGASPRSPYHQGKWEAEDITLWIYESDDCTVGTLSFTEGLNVLSPTKLEGTEEAAATGGSGPANPVFTLSKGQNAIFLHYRFGKTPTSVAIRPSVLLTTVDPAGSKYVPMTTRTALANKTGTVRMPLNSRRGPYVIRVSVLSKTGLRSKTVSVSLK